jgi:hypothetical protein
VEINRVFVVGKYSKQVYSIQNQIKNGNYSLQVVSEFNDCDLYLSFDLVDYTCITNYSNSKIMKVLIRQEPKIVLPQTYMEENIANFDYIIDVGKLKSGKLRVLNWPQDLTPYIKNPKTKNNRVVIINSNLLSLAKGENYSLRRQAINCIQELDLYGYQWNNSFDKKIKTFFIELKKYAFKFNLLRIKGIKSYFRYYDNYLGEVEDKRSVISMYKYCLVIENSSDYLSEKLFDALLSGCIPIYVGPDLAKYEIPRSLYLQAQPNLNDIRFKINEAKKINYNEWVENLNIWLSESKTYENWSEHLFLSKIFKLVNDITNNTHLQP